MLKQMEPKMEQIGDTKFYITPFPAFKAANLSGRLASLLSPLAGIISTLLSDDNGSDNNDSDNKDLMDVDVNKVANLMMHGVEIDGDKLEKLLQELLLGGHIAVEVETEDGEQEVRRLDRDLVNEIFCGNVQDMFVLSFYVIRLNYNGFFKRLSGLSGTEKLVEMRKIL